MVDKTLTNAYYEIEIDHTRGLPVHLRIVILTGTKGTNTEANGMKITGGKHVAFHYDYDLSDFEKLQPPKIPAEAWKQLVSR